MVGARTSFSYNLPSSFQIPGASASLHPLSARAKQLTKLILAGVKSNHPIRGNSENMITPTKNEANFLKIIF